MNISEPFIRRPVGTSLLALGLFLSGLVAYRFMPVAAIPRVDYPMITVSASLPGADPATVASSLATPLERRLGQIAGVTEMTSVSTLGGCNVSLQFDLNRKVDDAAHDVQAAINAAATDLPANLPNPPTYRKVNPADAPIMILALTSDTLPQSEIFEFADSILGQKLSQVEGVSQALISGAEKSAVRVQVNPGALAAANVSLEEVRSTLSQVNVNLPLGSFDDDQVSHTIVINGQMLDAKPYQQLILRQTNNSPLRLDAFGRAIEGARATFTASADDLESAKLSVQAQVAIDYFTLRALDTQSDLLTQTVAAYQRALELTQNRHRAGIASDLDVSQAETQLKSTRAQIPAVDLQRAQLRHALAVLCGQVATTFTLTPNTVAPTNLPAIPVAVPSEWLESRPDISAAERRMAAANANIGVAKAAFYPRVLLNGSGGFESVSASDWFAWPSHLWAIGPTLQLPIFTGGRNRAQLASARAAYDATVATYRQTVLTAFQDVEDQLAAQRLLAQQLDEENAALASAQRTLDISNNRYKAGVEQYLDVIIAQATELTHKQNAVQLNGQRLAASVSLIKALGAGWQPTSITTVER